VIARATGPYLLGWPIWASIAAHGVAIATASTVVALAPHAPPPRAPAPIEVVRVEPPPPPPPPPERPKPIPRERALAPRAITQPIEPPRSVAPPALLSEAPQRADASPMDTPTSAPERMPGPPGAQSWALSGSPGGSSAGSGKLFSTGDLPLPPGGGGNKQQTASTGNPSDLTSFARPLGGYQTRPRYPDSARRQGIEGEALLRFQVLTDGHVASVTVTRSAGHADLDRAAVDAVRTWRFEPARRGEEKVTVWVTLPVRFQLQSGMLSE
jgi:periplasmic protein TonB